MNKSNFSIITFYEFKNIDDLDIQKIELKKFCLFNKLRGTVILAKEGINIQLITTSEIKISVVIEEKYLELAVRSLHSTFDLGDPNFNAEGK